MLNTLKSIVDRFRAGDKAKASGGQSAAVNWDRGFEEYRRKYPSATFAEYYVMLARQAIDAGKAHPTLGAKLNHNRRDRGADREFRKAAQAAFVSYRRFGDIKPDHRVIDYGCGSLRLGVHFIEYLSSGNYMGLDVTRDFIDIGVALVGSDTIREKNAQLDSISEASIEAAAAFEADRVISNAVSYHVHPDELKTYYSNLVRMTVKRGSILLFDAKLSEAPLRYKMRGWAQPLEHVVSGLRPLVFVGVKRKTEISDDRAKDAPVHGAILEFRRT